MKKFFLSALAVTAVFLVMELTGPALASLSEEQMYSIWQNNGGIDGIQVFRYGAVDWTGRSVTSQGKAPLVSPAPHDRLLAKRGALADARRNLLLLLYEMKIGLPERLQAIEVTGEIVEGNVDFTGINDGMYIVEVTVPLGRFLSESLIFSSSVR